MKINPLLIVLFFIMTTAIAKAQKYTRFNKPIIDLNNKPQVTTPKLPEERRKLSIFPKSMVKYVVTSKPYARVRTYSPYQVTTKRSVMQQLVPKEMKNMKTMAATRAPIMKYITPSTTQYTPKRQFAPRIQFNTKPPVAQVPEHSNFYESEEDSYIEAPSTRYNVAYNSENNLSSFDEKDYEDENEDKNSDIELNTYSSTDKTENINESLDLDAVESNDSSKVNENKTLKKANKVETENNPVKEKLINFNKELEKEKEGQKNEEKQDVRKVYDEESEEEKEKNVDVIIESGIRESENEEKQNAVTTTPDLSAKEPEYQETESKELENSRKKRLTVLGRSVYNNIEMSNKSTKEDTSAKDNNDIASERNDRNEFIFIKDYLKAPIDIKKSSNYIAAEIEDSVEIATEIAWLEEYKSRPERSINVIEEENLGTTVAGFKFTGREPRVDSDLVFRNINA